MLQLSSILVPLDGSSFAEQALPFARQLALASGASLRLAYAHTPATTGDPGVEFRLFDPKEEQVRQNELAYLETMAKRLTNGGGLHVECALLKGTTAPALEDYVERTGTDLVVMTSHGRGGIGRLMLGNVADQLVRRLNVPVLVIRPGEKASPAESQRRRILVPLDGSPLAESIMEEAKTFARITESELMLVMIVLPLPILLPPYAWPPETLTQSPEHRELAARQYLEAVMKQLKNEGLAVQSRVRTARKVTREILQVAKDEECNMVAMATHGSSGLDRMMLGSVADQVVRHADIPVLLLRPQLAEQAEDESFPNAAAEFVAR